MSCPNCKCDSCIVPDGLVLGLTREELEKLPGEVFMAAKRDIERGVRRLREAAAEDLRSPWMPR